MYNRCTASYTICLYSNCLPVLCCWQQHTRKNFQSLLNDGIVGDSQDRSRLAYR